MNKSVYELSKKEIADYVNEYNKTEFASKFVKTKKESGVILVIVLIILFVLAGIATFSGKPDTELTSSNGVLEIFFWISFIFYFVSTIVLKLTFYRWLKIKHKIEY